MKITKLENIAEVSAGQGAPQGDDSYSKVGLPFIKAGNLEDLIITNDEYKSCKLVNEEIANKYKLKLYPKDTLVFAKSGMSATKDRIYCLNNKAYVVNHLSTIIPNAKFIEVKYLKYIFYILPPSRLIKDESYPSISLDDIKKMDIPLPPLSEQRSIVKKLDEADALRQKRKQAIKLLNESLESTFLDMFGDPVNNPKKWSAKSWEEYSELLTVGVVIKPASHYVEKGVIALRSLNIKPNSIDLGNLVYFSKEAHNGILSKSRLQSNDVVLVRTGLTGTAAVIPEALNNANCIDMIILRPNKRVVNPFYLSYFFNSERGKQIVTAKEVGGIQKHFNIGAIKKMKILIPSIDLQNRFAEIVCKTESLKQVMLAQSKELENQFQALMQKAFKGQL